MSRSSLKSRRQAKPSKPYPSFPLTAHNNGQWCKKIRGKIHFFGVWSDPEIALSSYLRVAEDLHAGRKPRSNLVPEGLTVKDVCNHFLTYQLAKVEAGEITPRWFEDCRRVAECFAKFAKSGRVVADLAAQDFQEFRQGIVRRGLGSRSKGLGVHALNRAITVIRGMFKYAYEIDLIDRPVKVGKAFDRPSAAAKRKTRKSAELENGKRLLQVSEIRAILDDTEIPLLAMVLLGINGGFGNTDCARLPIAALDLKRGVVEFDRPKTGVERVVPLWAETVAALGDSLDQRPKPADEAAKKLVFLTTFGRPWVREIVHRRADNGVDKVVPVDAIGAQFGKLARRLGIKRKGIGFYALRHTFRTWADEVKDQHAIHRIMGHAIPGMSGIYVEEIGLERLRAVVDHVRTKLFSSDSQEDRGGIDD